MEVSTDAFEEHEAESIASYVISQSPPGEKVRHAERLAKRHIYGDEYELWDVRTRRHRWWVITNPTNLYSQTHFPSMDMAFTYHLGLGIVLAAREAPPIEDDDILTTAGPWRRWREASEALERAVESEDFQAVGVRSREALLDAVRVLGRTDMAKTGTEPPKAGDFIHWSQLIADAMLRGPRRAEVRRHVKAVAKSGWQLASWLTHAKNAHRSDASVVVAATGHAIEMLVTSVLKDRRDRDAATCPTCGSRRVHDEWDPDTNTYTGRVLRCLACGLELPEAAEQRREMREMTRRMVETKGSEIALPVRSQP